MSASRFAVLGHCNRWLRNRQEGLMDNPAALCYNGVRSHRGGVSMTLGERLIMLRSKAGLSQDDLAGRLGVSRQSVSKWENNPSQT